MSRDTDTKVWLEGVPRALLVPATIATIEHELEQVRARARHLKATGAGRAPTMVEFSWRGGEKVRWRIDATIVAMEEVAAVVS